MSEVSERVMLCALVFIGTMLFGILWVLTHISHILEKMR